mmetsp:Transcript_40316/g.46154  ORF Transcript_40316/g.46154 Transcript_40316/m.46154 type:complete len:97 (-) Transcript_40316:2-292(-)
MIFSSPFCFLTEGGGRRKEFQRFMCEVNQREDIKRSLICNFFFLASLILLRICLPPIVLNDRDAQSRCSSSSDESKMDHPDFCVELTFTSEVYCRK